MNQPSWLTIAKSRIGVREIVGTKHSPTIMGWINRLGAKVLGILVTSDETPWCGTFVASVMVDAGVAPPKIAVRAMSWATWGQDLRADRLSPGAVLVFQRPGGGHVGLYVGEDASAYHVLGGNQGNAVSITRIVKSRCVARRWPDGVPVTGAPVWLTAGGAISRNEA